MRPLFDRLTRLSIRFWPVTIALSVLLMVLGVYAALSFNIELVPSIDIPSTFILARSGGSTSGNIMLQAYTIPIERGASAIAGVVNHESSTTTGVAFLQIRNEFGLDQAKIVQELRQVLDDLPLPLRTIRPAGGATPQSMIGELDPQAVLYLHAYSQQEGIRFLSALNREVWLSFAPEVLAAVPESVFSELDRGLAQELLSRRPTDVPAALLQVPVAPPPLPASWQMDRFETVEDLIEITGVRDLAQIFNDFITDGYISGPLARVSDLTIADLGTLLAIEARCQKGQDGETPDADPGQNSAATPCRLFGYLDGDSVAALLVHFGAGADGMTGTTRVLPADYLELLSGEDQARVAAVAVAQMLTGQRVPRDASLPAEWLLERPQIITFSFDDIPLGVISISADISNAELRHLVENEIVPRLEAVEVIADVTIEGGERIRPDLLAAALEAEGLPAELNSREDSQGTSQPSTSAAGTANAPATASADAGTSESRPALEEGPPLPAVWSLFATQFPGVDALDTADDLFAIAGITPSGLLNQAVALTSDNPALAAIVNRAIAELSPEALQYLAAHEAGFFAALSNPVLRLFPPETAATLPPDVQERVASAKTPPLGEFWLRLSAEPELAGTPLTTAADLLHFGTGAAATLNQIVAETPSSLTFYTAQLLNDLPPDAIAYLAATEPQFVDDLQPATLCYFAPASLNVPAIRARWSAAPWDCTLPDGSVAPISAIADGTVPSAAQRFLGTQGATRIHDPQAPPRPANWPPIAGFVGAQELDTADDLFFTVRNGTLATPSQRLNDFASPDGAPYVQTLQADVLHYIADCTWGQLCEEGFFDKLSDRFLTYLSDQTAQQLPENVQERRRNAQLGIYVPQAAVTRTNGNTSLILQLRKQTGANTVQAWSEMEDVLQEIEDQHPEIAIATVFEQASYIEESISGVAREGGLGAIMAVVVILIFLNFSVRSTLVTAVSIPTSVALAFVLMRWVPANVHNALLPLSEDASGVAKAALIFIMRLFPADISLNIMTLSGLTVAIGRVVDDAIVVLENIYRNIQAGENRLEAVLHGTRDVSVAIFAATVTTVVVFLPIGLFGGIIGAFFLPFGLAVTYALMSSFLVAITLVPLLAYTFIGRNPTSAHRESRMERGYRAIITWALAHRWAVMGLATVAFVVGVIVLTQLPTAFLPSFGEPTITVDISLPVQIDGRATTIALTDAKVRRLEQFLATLEGVTTFQTSVGSGSNAGFFGSETVEENIATVTISVPTQDDLTALTPVIRAEAARIFNDLDRDGTPDPSQDNVKVSGTSLSEQGFGGFAVVLSGDPANPPTLAELRQYDALIIATLQQIKGITNVESSLSQLSAAGGDVAHTYLRVDGVPAARYTAELETDDTLGLTREAIAALRKLDLPANLTIDEGYESRQQTEGFRQTFISMGIAVVIVYAVMVLTFSSAIHPITILFSLPLATVGAAVGLAVTGRVLGLSAVVGLLMLVGIVVTNAIVLIDRVQTNRKLRGMSTRQALIEGGTTRLRPILMTAVATMVALLPLAIGLSQGAIIAAELGTVVIGGLFSSTFLTLIVVPVVFSLFDGASMSITRRLALSRRPAARE